MNKTKRALSLIMAICMLISLMPAAFAAEGYEFAYWADATGNVLSTKTEETGAEVKAEPTVVLDTINGEHFLTYNVPAGYTKLEAGILFAESGKPTIGSFHSKATEKTGSGQFTAKPNGTDDTIARGYMIFRDSDNSIRVIYAD